jgi:hypothetical protein
MADLLASVRTYLQDPLTEADVVVREVPVRKFSIALSNTIEMLWEQRDFDLAETYKKRLIDEEPPAIIIQNGGVVVDGFHRLYAAQLANQPFIKAINLSELYQKLLEWYD